MKILCTGVPGWLGNRFLEILTDGPDGKGAADGWEIRLLILPGSDTSFVRQLPGPRKVECASGDVRDPASLKKVLEGVDIVFHMAGVIHPRRIRELYDINVRGTENVLAAAAENGVRRLVFISSNSVGGVNRAPDALMKETDPPRPYMHYGMSKHLAERAVRRRQDAGGMETVILRPCWYYGPNQPPRQTTFFKMIKKGNPIIFGDGKNLRSMTYLDNLCEAMLLAASEPRANGQTYWIADERPYTTNEIYETIAELLEVRNFRPRRAPSLVSEGCLAADFLLQAAGLYVKEIHVAGEMNKNIACDIRKARSELGYAPRIGLREGMRISIEWCRRHGLDI